MPKKPSFFERLTGAVNAEDDELFDDMDSSPIERSMPTKKADDGDKESDWAQEPPAEAAQLTVDVYQTPDDIIIKAMVAGVAPDELDISITREMVSITGHRQFSETVSEADFFHKELYWGSFTRTVLLPEEVDVEEAEAIEKHGMLTIRLPKIDKKKQTKLSVRSS